ncbi:hypothetical protein [Anaeromicropila populeti]|uniref:FlgN protein n=1 Tax=Anaeromicropila populeti TaxID=37658 RepID=A0A1I6HWW5_9FIRM|nr:hypothetical protein [Anaeromicropila populeti]SFR58898.1 hypothetical protein SAMN05661086_00361 [Anaeromicropila populeti]
MEKTVYLRILNDTLHRKQEALKMLKELTKQQEELLKAESFDEEAFNSKMDEKECYIKKLVELDNGFELIYQRVKNEIAECRNELKEEILLMQKLISEITALSVDVEVLEKKNRPVLERKIIDKKKKIKEVRLSNQTAASYYKNMTSQVQGQSYFLDQKK